MHAKIFIVLVPIKSPNVSEESFLLAAAAAAAFTVGRDFRLSWSSI